MARLRDVAALAGVGMGTASRALSGRGYVDPDTRAKIKSAADQLGYRPNAIAKALREQRTRIVGLVLPDLANEFYTEAAGVLQHILAEADYDVIVSVSGNDTEVEARGIESLTERRVDAIIHVPVDPELALPTTTPIVQLNRHSIPLQVPAVVSDDAHGIAELTDLLVGQGHRDIAFIGGGPIHSTSMERLAAFRTAATAAGLSDEGATGFRSHSNDRNRFRICAGEFTSAWGRQAIHHLRADPPTAVVAASSRIALGVMHGCRDLGIDVPNDLSVAAHGDPEWYEVLAPGITSYAPPLAEIGRAVADLILARISDADSPATPPTVTRVRGEIVTRGSVAKRSP